MILDQLIIVVALLALMPGNFKAGPDRSGSIVQNESSDISNGLGWNCLSGSSGHHNLLFSPVSVASTLAILYYGSLSDSFQAARCEISALLQPVNLPGSCSDAKGAGKSLAATSKEEQCYCPHGMYLRSLLSTFHAYNTSNVTIDTATGIWHHGHLHPLFKREVVEYFLPDLMTLHPHKPHNTSLQINNWVNMMTRGKVPTIITPYDIKVNDRLFLFNVLYFQGLWQMSFANHTERGCFITCKACQGELNAEKLEVVDYMEKTESVPFCEMPSESLTAIEMSYANSGVTMTIILPRLCSLRKIEQELSNGDLLQRINYCLNLRKLVKIVLPKFRLEQNLPINSILSKLGLESVYSSGFSTILKDVYNLQLSRVSHQSVLEVDDKGSEAAAVSGITFDGVSVPPVFKVSHPFIVISALQVLCYSWVGIVHQPDRDWWISSQDLFVVMMIPPVMDNRLSNC